MTSEHPFFATVGSRRLTGENFDEAVAGPGLRIVFLWGHDCPNCEIAKNTMARNSDEVLARAVQWFDVNVYDHSEMGTRFGLHGIPVFLFFKDGKLLGRVTSFPGLDPFLATMDRHL